MIDYLPDLHVKVIYPKSTKLHWMTLFNIKMQDLERSLIIKVANEFKHCLSHYNPYNFIDEMLPLRLTLYLDDYNNYDCFQGDTNENEDENGIQM